MDGDRINKWLSLVANVGVLCGLILVAYEIRQSTQQATGESIIELQGAYREILISDYETDIAEHLVKSYSNPDELTDTEIVQLSSYLSTIIGWHHMYFDLHELGVTRYDATADLIEDSDYYFTGPFGRAWYAENRFWMEPSVVAVLDHELEVRPVRATPPYTEEIRSRLRNFTPQ